MFDKIENAMLTKPTVLPDEMLDHVAAGGGDVRFALPSIPLFETALRSTIGSSFYYILPFIEGVARAAFGFGF